MVGFLLARANQRRGSRQGVEGVQNLKAVVAASQIQGVPEAG